MHRSLLALALAAAVASPLHAAETSGAEAMVKQTAAAGHRMAA